MTVNVAGGGVGRLDDGCPGRGGPAVKGVEVAVAGKGAGRHTAVETGIIGVVHGKADGHVVVGNGIAVVAGWTLHQQNVVPVMGSGIGGRGPKGVTRRIGQAADRRRRIAMTVVALGAADVFKAAVVGVAFHAIGARVVIEIGNLAGAVLVEPGAVMADLADVLGSGARTVVIAEDPGSYGCCC